MNTYHLDGYVIAAASLTQANFAAKQLREAGVTRDYDPLGEIPCPEYPAWLAEAHPVCSCPPGTYHLHDED